MNDDLHFMQEALCLARQGVGLTAPNPPVGCVLVKHGEIIGRGWHRAAGQAHAEVEAFRDCASQGHDAKGATAYVTLEPCSTVGRTPACTTALRQAGVSRVVWSCDDPNPAHVGRAKELLEMAGIQTTSGLLEKEGRFLIRAFAKVQQSGLPWLIVKVAMSLDGRITRPPGEGQWLTGAMAREDVQILRGEVDAILTSGRTARIDDPSLTYRGARKDKKPLTRLVLSRQDFAGLPSTAKLRSDEYAEHTRFLTGDLTKHLLQLAQEGFHSILIEAGGELVGHLFSEGLVDEYVAYLAPLVCGGPDLAVAGRGRPNFNEAIRLGDVSYEQFGNDIRLRGLVVQKHAETQG